MKMHSKIAIFMSIFVIISAMIFGYTNYLNEKDSIIKGIDNKLFTAANMAREILPADYHDKITGPESVSPEDYLKTVKLWNRICTQLKLEYIWSVAKIDGSIVFTTGTSTSKNAANGDHALFFEKHSNPEPYVKTFNAMKPQYRINADKWGRIRAVLVPFYDKQKRRYLFGASMKMTEVDKAVSKAIYQSLESGGVILVIGLLFSLFLSRSLAKPLENLSSFARKITRGDDVAEVRVTGVSEVVELSEDIDYLQKSLKSKIYELKESQENLKVTLNSIGDAVIATGIDGCVTMMNPVAEQLTGWKVEEAVGRPLPEVFKIVNAESRENVENPVARVLSSGEIVGLANHTVLISKNGSEYQIADSGAPIRSSSNEITGVVLVFRDVTRGYEIEEQVRHSQKMEAIGQLAGGVAHDFNNMLGGIMGAAELMTMKLDKEHACRKYLDMIIKSSGHAADLTSRLLTFARKQPKSSSPVDVHEVIVSSIDLLKNTLDKKTEIEAELSAEAFHVIGDQIQLQNALINLGINSSHAMPDGGKIFISTSVVDFDKIHCEASAFDLKPGAFIDIEFRDTGCGIPMQELKKIFDPFYTTKERGKGTGLGLSTVYGTVEHHNGAISVYSAEGSGACFHLMLPLTEEECILKHKPDDLVSGNGSILLVDDEQVMRTTGQAILENLGYEVTLAENGKHGLDIFEKTPDAYDLVILDMIMPVMNGRACFVAMRNVRHDVKIILSSGFSREEDIQEMKAAGLSGFIRKPFRSSTLSQVVKNAIDNSI